MVPQPPKRRVLVVGDDLSRGMAEAAIGMLCDADSTSGGLIVTIPLRRAPEIDLDTFDVRPARDYQRPPPMTGREAKRQNRAMRRK